MATAIPVEILHSFKPSAEEMIACKVHQTTAQHLSHAEREAITGGLASFESLANLLGVRSSQHVGVVGDALDLASTIASAGEAISQFVLNRPLINAEELAGCKVALTRCMQTARDVLASLMNEDQRSGVAAMLVAEQFLSWAPDFFKPLFEDLERMARKRFPHLGPQLDAPLAHEMGERDV